MPTTIRPMTPDDVGPAAASVLRGDWGNRGPFFAWAARHPQARPFVAESGGAVVGTAVGTVSGRVGWVGAVFVDGDRRGQGLGRGLTDAVVDALEAAGCRTLLLVATQAGRPIYERMGFRPDTTYHTIEAPGTGAAGAPTPSAATLERWSPTDLDAMARLDRLVTGEDRRHLLEAFSSPAAARVLREPSGEMRGFIVRAVWGGGATIAPRPEDGIAILEARRVAAGPDRRVRAGLVTAGLHAMERLAPLGWTAAWSAPRLIRGEPLDWQPEGIWGQFNHAIG